MRVAWYISAPNLISASVRYRAAIPSLRTAEHGIESALFWHPFDPLAWAPDLIVFVKTFAPHALEIARRAASEGIPVVFDACDNVYGYQRSQSAQVASFEEAAGLASAFVTTNQGLAEEFARALRGGPRIGVIPDPVETRADVADVASLLRMQRLERIRSCFGAPKILARELKATVARHSAAIERARQRVPTEPRDASNLVWFGGPGSPEGRFGIDSLVDVAESLVSLERAIPLRLRVISDPAAYETYRRRIAPLPFRSEFVRWHPHRTLGHIAGCGVTVLPNSSDPISYFKSANRATLALSLGVAVVATKVPSLEPLDGCILTGEISGDVLRYMEDEELRQTHLDRAQKLIREQYEPAAVGRLWADLLRRAAGGAASSAHPVQDAPASP